MVLQCWIVFLDIYEFHSAFSAIETATSANVKGHKYRQKMKDAIEDGERRRKYRWIGRMFKGFGGAIMGLLWIGMIFAIVGAAGYFGWLYFNP
ncbi:MAG: hypothetical protein EXR98_16990 [Gemmataceae bacterium]|nr:hypothetical protein [Gemmataceae bacterium]